MRLWLLCCVWLVGCSQQEPVTAVPLLSDAIPAKGDRWVSASSADASNLIPMIASDASSHAIAGQLYLSLLKYDADLNLVGQLAESWALSDDQKTIRFTLRKGLHWSDGQPFSSADCLFTLNLIRDKHTQSPYKSDYSRIVSFSAPDALHFEVHYPDVYAPALSSWASLAILPKHVFAGEDIMHTTLSRQPKATIGPYQVVDWQAQQSILLQANPDYYDGTVWLQQRLTRIIPDASTQWMEMDAGRLDEMSITPIQSERVLPKRPGLQARFARYQSLGFGYTYLGFNFKRPMFQDKRVRQAMAYAINRQELLDGVLLGLGEVIATPYKPGTYWVNQKIKPYAYDPQKAKALLSAAGWHDDDGDGVLEKQGKRFEFTILSNNGNKQRADTATILQQRLQAVGIQVHIRLVEWSAFIEHFINTRNFDAIILGWSLSPEPDQFSIWHSSQTGSRQFNFLSYQSDQVDQALVAASKTFDKQQRKIYYDRMQQAIHEDVPVVFLYAPYSVSLMHKRLYGVKQVPAGLSYDHEHWYVPKALQQHHLAISAD